MKILSINTSIDPVTGGGTAERTIQMSKALAERGHICTILTLDIGTIDHYRKTLSHSFLIVIPCLWDRFYLPAPKFSLISEAVQNTDIVHLMGHWSIINVIAYFFICRFRKKYVICPAGALPIFGRSSFIKRIYNAVAGVRIVKNANAHIAISMTEVAHYQTYGVSLSTISHIPNGITSFEPSLVKQNIRTLLKLPYSPYILFIGRLNFIKGPDLLIEAFGLIKYQFPNHQLFLVGPDEGLKAALILRSRNLGIEDRVHFVGYVGGASKYELLIQADLMVIPSRQEAMSIVVLEAGLANTPVVLTDQCGLNELHDMRLATVVQVSAHDIANGIQSSLFDRAASLRAAKNFKEYITEKFLWKTIALKLEKLFASVLDG